MHSQFKIAYEAAQKHLKETMGSPEFQFQEIQDALMKIRGAEGYVTAVDLITKVEETITKVFDSFAGQSYDEAELAKKLHEELLKLVPNASF